MSISRIDWSQVINSRIRVVPVVLVAGVPVVLVPAGIHPTTVAATSGSLDPLFWPGTGSLTETLPDASTFDPVRDLLNPAEVFEVYEKVNLLKGSVGVDPLTFTLQDVDGAATALLSHREGRTGQLLGADLLASATTITLASTVGMPTSGIACVGRETVTYGGVSGSDLTTVVRGKYGSRARFHASPATHRPVVTAGYPPHWQGRVCTLWLCHLSENGIVLRDPSLVYCGTIGPGVQLTNNLLTWSVSLDHITESLSRKIETPSMSLYGYTHYTPDLGIHPLLYQRRVGGVYVDGSLQDDVTDDMDQGGWHPSLQSFIDDTDRKVRSVTTDQSSVQLQGDGRVTVTVTGTDANPTFHWISPGFDMGNRWFGRRIDTDTNDGLGRAAWVSTAPAPEAFFRLQGWVRVPRAEDFATIPTTLSYPFSNASGAGTAIISLQADTDVLKDVCCPIVERDSARQRVRLEIPLEELGRFMTTGATVAQPLLCTQRTAARLVVVARGDNASVALQAGALALDALTGQDLYTELVDWDDLERSLGAAPTGGMPTAREYRFKSGDDSFLDLLIQELRIRGMSLTVRHGKLTGLRLQVFSDSEHVSLDIAETDGVTEGDGEVPAEVLDHTGDPFASSMEFELPGRADKPTLVTITDTTYKDEFGDGETVKCNALMSLPAGLFPSINVTQEYLFGIAQQVLGALAEPNRTIRLTLPPTYMGLQPGQLVGLTHSRIPNWEGSRGFEDAVCQVFEVRRQLFGGRLRVIVAIRYQSGSYVGYAPEALVAPGGLNALSTTVQLDTGSLWGPTCWAQDTDAEGNPVTSAVDGFEVGDVVALTQIGVLVPIADEVRTVVSVDPVLNRIVLSAAPSSGMAATASVRYSVMLRFAPYASCTDRQKSLFGWIANVSTQVLGTSDPAKRWAA